VPDLSDSSKRRGPDRWVPRLLQDLTETLWAEGYDGPAEDLEKVLSKHWPDAVREEPDAFVEAAMNTARH